MPGLRLQSDWVRLLHYVVEEQLDLKPKRNSTGWNMSKWQHMYNEQKPWNSLTSWLISAVHGTGSREWCLDLVNFPPNSWLWMICTTQTCLFIIRCLGSSLQLAASASSIHLCLWYQLLSWTCSSYPKREFPSIRHNHEIRDLTDDLLTEVCSDVHIELDLQPVEGEMLTVSLY